MLDRSMIPGLLGASTLSVLSGVCAGADQVAALSSFDFHHREILGTAMDLTIVAPTRADAEAAEKIVLGEIERMRKILSAYDTDAELARLNASPVNGAGLPASSELIDVLKQYDELSKRTSGAYSGHMGDLIALWKNAEKQNRLPSDDELAAVCKRIKASAWEIDEEKKTVRRVSDQQINVDSLGKGYIVGKALAEVTRKPGNVKGMMLSIGGDIRVWGNPPGKPGQPWAIGVQDPAHPELNAKPLTTLYVPSDCAIATSRSYQRFYTIQGKQYSHILDARTGKPGRNTAATVISPDSATANAMATISCIMKYAEGLELIRTTPAADAMIILPDGTRMRTDGWKDLESPTQAIASGPRLPIQFPTDFKMKIDLETAPSGRRPYVFVWITDAQNKHVKTIGAWGNEARYWRDMKEWWKIAQTNRALQAVTHATQSAGKYPLAWDGTDQRGSGVPLGTYKVWVEVAVEKGPYSCKVGSITLDKDPASATIASSSAFKDVKITYGPAKK